MVNKFTRKFPIGARWPLTSARLDDKSACNGASAIRKCDAKADIYFLGRRGIRHFVGRALNGETRENIYKRKDGRYEGRFIRGYQSGITHLGICLWQALLRCQKRLIQKKMKQPGIHYNKTAWFGAFEDWFTYWLDTSVKPKVKVSTYACYQTIANKHICLAMKAFAYRITSKARHHAGKDASGRLVFRHMQKRVQVIQGGRRSGPCGAPYIGQPVQRSISEREGVIGPRPDRLRAGESNPVRLGAI
jgi:hypothetical protein